MGRNGRTANRRGRPANDNRQRMSPAAAWMDSFSSFPHLKADTFWEPFQRYTSAKTEREKIRARDEIVYGNRKLIMKVAQKYVGRGVDLVDLLQVAAIGLAEKAVPKFDPSKGTTFSTYAMYWIRQSIAREIMNCGKDIRVPVHMQELLNHMHKATHEVQSATGSAPTNDELQAQLKTHESKAAQGITSKRLRDSRHFMQQRTISMQTPHYDSDGSPSTLEQILSDPQADVEAIVAARQEAREHAQAIAEMVAIVRAMVSPRDTEIFLLYFGLDEREDGPVNMRRIAERIGITRQRVEQIIKRICDKLELTCEDIFALVDTLELLATIGS